MGKYKTFGKRPTKKAGRDDFLEKSIEMNVKKSRKAQLSEGELLISLWNLCLGTKGKEFM